MNKTNSPFIVALDVNDTQKALDIARQLGSQRCRVKVGKELFTRAGPHCVEKLIAEGFEVFLDLKYHDIPNTVARACQVAADLGVWMISIHALGGRKMLMAAKEVLTKHANPPKLAAVTILTSLVVEDLYALGLHGTLEENVLRLGRLARACELECIICSPLEIALFREKLDKDLILVTPGIRPSGETLADQQRVMTPKEALNLGANYLVIGRPITTAPSPLQALQQIEATCYPKEGI